MMGPEGGWGHMMWTGHWFWMLAMAVLIVVPMWRICQRAGFPGWFGAFVLIPMLNLVLLYFLAFAEWPARRGDE